MRLLPIGEEKLGGRVGVGGGGTPRSVFDLAVRISTEKGEQACILIQVLLKPAWGLRVWDLSSQGISL